jgi:hypothetical protein
VTAPRTYPTPYPEVNAVMDLLLSGVREILGDHFVGLYLQGSLASGDFDPLCSDVDFVVVTADTVPDEMLPALKAMHARIGVSGLMMATRLDGDYMPRQSLSRYDPAHAPYPHLGLDGHFAVETGASDSIFQRYILRECGVVVAGPALRDWIQPIQSEDLRRAVRGVSGWWVSLADDPTRHSHEYQIHAVLTMCRSLYTLKHGTAVSKAVAAQWVQETLGERWSALIAWALSSRHDPQTDNLSETLDFVRYALGRYRFMPGG